MTDRILRADKLRDDKALHGRISRRTLLCRVGIVAALAAAAGFATTLPASAQSQQQPPGAQPPPPKAAPKRRGISAPESSAPSPSGKSYKGDDDSVPGGLPGAQPKPQPMPGGGPANPGG
jgi:hypothetical protein